MSIVFLKLVLFVYRGMLPSVKKLHFLEMVKLPAAATLRNTERFQPLCA
jgi:hypothetical protein